MLIIGMTTYIESQEFEPEYTKIRVAVSSKDGIQHHMVTMYHKDDLKSNFEILWEVAGRRLLEYLRRKDEALSNTGKTI